MCVKVYKRPPPTILIDLSLLILFLWQLTGPRVLPLEPPNREDDDTNSKSNRFPKTCIPVTHFCLEQGSEQLRNYSTRQQQQQWPFTTTTTFCAKCGTPILCSFHDESRNVYINRHTLSSSDWNSPMPQSSAVSLPKQVESSSSSFQSHISPYKSSEPSSSASSSSGMVVVDDDTFCITSGSSLATVQQHQDDDDKSSTELLLVADATNKAASTTTRMEPAVLSLHAAVTEVTSTADGTTAMETGADTVTSTVRVTRTEPRVPQSIGWNFIDSSRSSSSTSPLRSSSSLLSLPTTSNDLVSSADQMKYFMRKHLVESSNQTKNNP
jgi:hypothetical protein